MFNDVFERDRRFVETWHSGVWMPREYQVDNFYSYIHQKYYYEFWNIPAQNMTTELELTNYGTEWRFYYDNHSVQLELF